MHGFDKSKSGKVVANTKLDNDVVVDIVKFNQINQLIYNSI